MHRRIQYTNKFKKLYKKLTPALQEEVKSTILHLKNNPFPEKLKVHKLSGKLFPYYSCSVDYKNRIIFEILDNGEILLLLVGNHDIYKN